MHSKIEYKGIMYYINSKKNGIYEFVDIVNNKKFIVNEKQYNMFCKIAEEKQINSVDYKKDSISFYNDMIAFEPFQYKPYLKLTNQDNKYKCLYIADEVGVGKTFETGIIISELLNLGSISLNEAILIVCPNMLCKKWQEVLHIFFGLSSKIAKKLDELSGISIISFDSISKSEEIDLDISLLIVDEAHNAGGNRHDKMMKLRRKSKYTVLLSATPLSGKKEEYKKQIELLFGNENNEFEFRNERINCYFNRTLKDDMRQKCVNWHIENISINNKVLVDYIKICEKIFNGSNTLKKFVGLNMIGSSPAAAKKYIDYLLNLKFDDVKKLLIGSQLKKEDIEYYGFENLEEVIEAVNCTENVEFNDEVQFIVTDYEIKGIIESIEGLLKEINELKSDAKLEALKKIIDRNEQYYLNKKDDEYIFYKKMVVFVNYNETAYYLQRNIKNSKLINGSIDTNEKIKRFNEFKSTESGKDILIITNVACEGLDMDFCNTIVNYDLTYNPIQLAQRKGRIDRFEVKKHNLYLYNFSIETIDPTEKDIKYFVLNSYNKITEYKNSIYTVLLRKLMEIKEKTGVYYNVLDMYGVTECMDDCKESARDAVIKYFKQMYGEKIQDFQSIKNLYKEKNNNKYIKINKFLKDKEISVLPKLEYIKINKSLNENKIENLSKVDGKIIIEVDKNNRDFLRHVYDGGTINSHLIYNDK